MAMATSQALPATVNVAGIAKVCHEANRAYCELIGDSTQPKWEEAPDWQRDSAMNGVIFHWKAFAEGVQTSPRQSHGNWLKEKEAAGWKYGPVKDPVRKEHPCFLPYAELPAEQKVKDYIFFSIVRAFFEAQAHA